MMWYQRGSSELSLTFIHRHVVDRFEIAYEPLDALSALVDTAFAQSIAVAPLHVVRINFAPVVAIPVGVELHAFTDLGMSPNWCRQRPPKIPLYLRCIGRLVEVELWYIRVLRPHQRFEETPEDQQLGVTRALLAGKEHWRVDQSLT